MIVLCFMQSQGYISSYITSISRVFHEYIRSYITSISGVYHEKNQEYIWSILGVITVPINFSHSDLDHRSEISGRIFRVSKRLTDDKASR